MLLSRRPCGRHDDVAATLNGSSSWLSPLCSFRTTAASERDANAVRPHSWQHHQKIIPTDARQNCTMSAELCLVLRFGGEHAGTHGRVPAKTFSFDAFSPMGPTRARSLHAHSAWSTIWPAPWWGSRTLGLRLSVCSNWRMAVGEVQRGEEHTASTTIYVPLMGAAAGLR